MKPFVCTVLVVLAWSGAARAVEFGEERAAGKRVTVCRVDVRKEGLRLFLRDEHGAGLPTVRCRWRGQCRQREERWPLP